MEKLPNWLYKASCKMMVWSFIALLAIILLFFLSCPFLKYMPFEAFEVYRKTFEWVSSILFVVFWITSGVFTSNLKDHIHWVDKDEASEDGGKKADDSEWRKGAAGMAFSRRRQTKPNQSDMVNFKEALGSISPKIRPGPSLIPGSQIFSVLSVRVDG